VAVTCRAQPYSATNIRTAPNKLEKQVKVPRAEDHGDEKQTSLDTVNGGAIIDHNAPRERRFVAVEK